MNQTRENLKRAMHDLEQKKADTHKTNMALEVSVTNKGSATEEALDQYTNLLSTLELFPPLQSPWEAIDLTLELNPAASNPQQLLNGSDIRKIIKPTLSAVAESKRAERSSVETERIKIDNELDQLSLECENVEEDTAEIEKKVAALNDQADDLRDVGFSSAIQPTLPIIVTDLRLLGSTAGSTGCECGGKSLGTGFGRRQNGSVG